MANTTSSKFDATSPLYAWVGAGELAVETLRKAALDLQAQLDTARAKSPKSVDEARERLAGRLDTLAKDAQSRIESGVTELQADAKALPGSAQARLTELQSEVKERFAKIEARLAELSTEIRSELNSTVSEQTSAYADLVARGEAVVAKLRGQAQKAETATEKTAAEVLTEVVDEVSALKDTAVTEMTAAKRSASRSTTKAAAKAAERVEEAAAKVEEQAAKVEEQAAKVEDTAAKVQRDVTADKPARKTSAAKKAPARKTTTATKAPAAKKAPAKRSTTRKTTGS